MERTKGRPLASPLLPGKPDGPKLRRKLQKNVGKSRGQQAARSSLDVPNEPTTLDTKPETRRKRSAENPSQPLPPDLSDAKWSAYVRASGYVSNLRPLSQSKQAPKPLESPVNIIPELSHLAITNNTSAGSSPLSSSDKLSPHSPASSTSTMRRLRAKTPVFAIGQLEGDSLERPQNALGSDKRSSAEILAEQYRALLQSRNSVFADTLPEPLPSRQDEGPKTAGAKRQSTGTSGEDDLHARRLSNELSQGSPTSDDGTLVSFEEDAIYFKPISFSPEPPQSPLRFQSPLGSPSPAPDNLSLQICMDLLRRDLASSITSRLSQASPEASALQVWVMIEAYERLRDQLTDTRLGYEEARQLEQMFGMWLRTLYSIHDSLNHQAGQAESDYEVLESEELD
ncbi:hypothetical protein GQ53DRAFT_742854 [Thozetella sp. PMI_491]|nr:hypothetical protein GQ53DRAFT_742854 [Thozetella sp. PMI_491]